MLPSAFLRVSSRRLPLHAVQRARARRMSSSPREPSRHAQFYTEFAAGMIPVAILGSAVYLGLRTWQQYLAHERFLEEAQTRVQELETEVTTLREQLQNGAQASLSSTGLSTEKKSGWWPW
ncbi:hypothetical protein ONZ51_g9098 [Trametes cubensis]|uniref:Uncharacterized protein n=1 Tax=Trametes cubensis TaxID=1111947 RepID=A0AAD7XA62_9APHY|nr:hypothetical protein ONZ51_g9098 [Trametes cubensis]